MAKKTPIEVTLDSENLKFHKNEMEKKEKYPEIFDIKTCASNEIIRVVQEDLNSIEHTNKIAKNAIKEIKDGKYNERISSLEIKLISHGKDIEYLQKETDSISKSVSVGMEKQEKSIQGVYSRLELHEKSVTASIQGVSDEFKKGTGWIIKLLVGGLVSFSSAVILILINMALNYMGVVR